MGGVSMQYCKDTYCGRYAESRVNESDGRHFHPRNLGWLLRHATEIDELRVAPIDGAAPEYESPGQQGWFKATSHRLNAYSDGRIRYAVIFADGSLLRQWIHRPVFRSLPLLW